MDFNIQNIGKRLREYRKETNTTQSDLAKELGLSTSAIGMYEQGRRTPPLDVLLEIAEVLDLDFEELVVDKVNSKMGIPIIGELVEGNPVVCNEHIIGHFPDIQQRADFALKVKGESMVDAGIFDGDIVFVDSETELVNNDVGAFLVDKKETSLKRYYKDGDTVILVPANPRHDIMRFTSDEIIYGKKDLKILGKVIALYSERSL